MKKCCGGSFELEMLEIFTRAWSLLKLKVVCIGYFKCFKVFFFKMKKKKKNQQKDASHPKNNKKSSHSKRNKKGGLEKRGNLKMKFIRKVEQGNSYNKILYFYFLYMEKDIFCSKNIFRDMYISRVYTKLKRNWKNLICIRANNFSKFVNF